MTSAAQADSDAEVGDVEGAESPVRATRLELALDWAAGLAPSPLVFATSCCGMALAQGGDAFEALGGGPPAVSARAADLLLVAGSLTERQAPLLQSLYERMLAPRWVVAWGGCAISGGPYAGYAAVSGLSRILPVDVEVPGCPPPPEAFREVLGLLRAGSVRDDASRQAREWPTKRPGETT